MNLSRKTSAGLAVAGVAVAGLGLFALGKQNAPPPAPRQTAVAKIGNVERSVLATGSLQPSNVIEVGAEVSGRVIELKVKLGDIVRRGDVLAVIDPFRLQNEVNQQKNRIDQAESELRDRLVQLDNLKANSERARILYERGATSKSQLDVQLANEVSRQSQVDNQRQQIENQRLILEQRSLDLARASVRAPMDGVVAQVVTHQGDVVNVFQTTPVIVKLARMDVMTVRTQISEADIMKVHPGQKAYFTILGEPQKRYYATLQSRELAPVGGGLDPNLKGRNRRAVYYNVVFEVPNRDEKLMPSMTAEVHLILDEAENVLTIPAAAVAENGAQPDTVEVVQADGSIRERQVHVGLTNNFVAEIKDGLEAGDRVVLAEVNTPAATGRP